MAVFVAFTRSSEIDRVFRRGRQTSGTYFSLKAAPGHGRHRVVIVTPKKLFKLAVDRNRMTRRTRALLRDMLPAVTHPMDLALLPRPQALHTPPAQLREDLSQLLTQLG